MSRNFLSWTMGCPVKVSLPGPSLQWPYQLGFSKHKLQARTEEVISATIGKCTACLSFLHIVCRIVSPAGRRELPSWRLCNCSRGGGSVITERASFPRGLLICNLRTLREPKASPSTSLLSYPHHRFQMVQTETEDLHSSVFT